MDTLEIDRPTRQAVRKPEDVPATAVSLSLQALGVPSQPVFLLPETGGDAGRAGGTETLWDRLRLSWQDPQTQRDLAPAHPPRAAGW